MREELLSLLGRGRSGVRQARNAGDDAALRTARARVGLAKRGLGERGTPWWEQTSEQRRSRWEAALAELRALDAGGP